MANYDPDWRIFFWHLSRVRWGRMSSSRFIRWNNFNDEHCHLSSDCHNCWQWSNLYGQQRALKRAVVWGNSHDSVIIHPILHESHQFDICRVNDPIGNEAVTGTAVQGPSRV